MVEVPQGPVNMTGPIMRLEDLVLSRKLRHDGNPLLRWCVMNAMTKTSTGELKRLVKTSARARIDAVVATLLGMSCLMADPGIGVKSIYESQGIRVF
jgi:phage terminase large subunit-like protein